MQPEKNIDVLNHGFVSLVSYPQCGGDLIAVNAARVSFGKKHDKFEDTDKGLIAYLIKNKHDSPFRHVQLTFRIKAPEFVMRQWYKHIVGISYTPEREVDHAWNEVSGRYVEMSDEFYFPESFRSQSTDNKQATTDQEIDASDEANKIYRESTEFSYQAYTKLLKLGVGKEISRAILPLNFYTEVMWTASLQAVMNFILLRDHDHAQHEIREYAQAIRKLIKDIAPITLDAWEKFRAN